MLLASCSLEGGLVRAEQALLLQQLQVCPKDFHAGEKKRIKRDGWMNMDGEVATAKQCPTISSMGGSHKVRRRSRDKNQYMREGAGDEQGLFIWDHVLLGGLKLRRTKLVRSAVG